MAEVWDLSKGEPKEVEVRGQVFVLAPEPDTRTAFHFQEIWRIEQLRRDRQEYCREQCYEIQSQEKDGDSDLVRTGRDVAVSRAIREMRHDIQKMDKDIEEVGRQLLDRVFGDGQYQAWEDTGMSPGEFQRLTMKVLNHFFADAMKELDDGTEGDGDPKAMSGGSSTMLGSNPTPAPSSVTSDANTG